MPPKDSTPTPSRLLTGELVSQLVEAILDAVLMVDLRGRIDFANASAVQMLEYPRDQLEGLPLAAIFADEDSAIATTKLKRVESGTALQTREVKLLTRHGDIVVAEVNGAAVTDADGIPKGIVLCARDLREVRELSKQAEAAKERGEVRRDVIARAIAMQEDERRKIARELHDESGQALTSLLAGLERLEKSVGLPELRSQVRELQRIAERTHVEIGRLAQGLRPAVLDDVGLSPALRRLVGEFSATHDVPVELIASGLRLRVPPEIETTIYRCVQEALSNAVKYAAATALAVSVQRQENNVVVVIEDDGRRADEASDDLGLASLRERAALLGGTLVIETESGTGATVYIRLPISDGSGVQDTPI